VDIGVGALQLPGGDEHIHIQRLHEPHRLFAAIIRLAPLTPEERV
jgi:hypothetical protein